jgi:hypothetical protein
VKEFITAAADSIGNVVEEDAVEFKHDGRVVKFYKPTTGQASIMMTMGGRDMDAQQAGVFIQLFLELMDEDTRRYFTGRLLDRNDPFSNLKSEGGLFDIWETLMEEWSARPTKQPSDYRPSRRSTGKSSTASTRAKASTSSRSRSTASSR